MSKKLKALRRITTTASNKPHIKEEIIEITVRDDYVFNGKNDVIRKTLIDKNGQEYEEITEIIPFAIEKDYLDYLKKNKR